MSFAYFAKRIINHPTGDDQVWVCVSVNCSSDAVAFYETMFTKENGYLQTKIVELD